ncbi:proline rich transmembrane protein 1B [Pogona vitticeps]
MEGSQACGASSPPHLGGGEGNGGDLDLPAENTPPSTLADLWRLSPKSAPPRARTDVGPDPPPGGANPSLAEEPPPYSPPDPKTLHLLFPAFQSSLSGQGPPFYPPRNRPSEAPPAPSPFAIYNSALFAEIPTEAERSCRHPPKDYMVESVLATLFCCLLTGAMALVYSHEARTAVNRGDLIQAKAASQKARSLVLFSLFFGVLVSASWVVYVLVTLYL